MGLAVLTVRLAATVPALMIILPVNVLAPESVSVPVFALVSAPAPLITPVNVWPAVLLTSSVPALEIAPA